MLYQYVKNPISISASSTKNLIVDSNHGKLTKDNDHLYWLEVDNLQPVTITVDNDGKTEQFYFRTFPIPDPIIYFIFDHGSEKFKNKYKAEKFKTLKSIQPSLDAFDYSCSYSISTLR